MDWRGTEMLEPNPQDLMSNWLKRGGRQEKPTITATLLAAGRRWSSSPRTQTPSVPRRPREARHTLKASTHRASPRNLTTHLSSALARVLTWVSCKSPNPTRAASKSCGGTCLAEELEPLQIILFFFDPFGSKSAVEELRPQALGF